MAKRHFTDDDRIRIVENAAGSDAIRAYCRTLGISETTFYRWRARLDIPSGLAVKRIARLERENRRLASLVADLVVEIAALRDVVKRSW